MGDQVSQRSLHELRLLHASKEEEQRLLEMLRRSPAFRRLESVQAVIAAYAAPATLNPATVASEQSGYQAPRPGTKSFRTIEAAKAYLHEKGSRAQVREIMTALLARGLAQEDLPSDKSLASVLSRSAVFDNLRGEGYGLREWEGRF